MTNLQVNSHAPTNTVLQELCILQDCNAFGESPSHIAGYSREGSLQSTVERGIHPSFNRLFRVGKKVPDC